MKAAQNMYQNLKPKSIIIKISQKKCLATGMKTSGEAFLVFCLLEYHMRIFINAFLDKV